MLMTHSTPPYDSLHLYDHAPLLFLLGTILVGFLFLVCEFFPHLADDLGYAAQRLRGVSFLHLVAHRLIVDTSNIIIINIIDRATPYYASSGHTYHGVQDVSAAPLGGTILLALLGDLASTLARPTIIVIVGATTLIIRPRTLGPLTLRLAFGGLRGSFLRLPLLG